MRPSDRAVFLGALLLRRTQSNAAIADSEPQETAGAAAERLAAGRANRRNFDTVRTELEQLTAPKNEPPKLGAIWPGTERRTAQTERRGMDALRADALKAVISRVEDRNFGGLRNRFQWPSRIRIPPSRLALLAVALLAGGTAAFLATHRDEPAPAPVQQASTPTPVVAAPTMQILVARQAIGVGQRLSAAAVGWQDWPQSALQSDYITNTATPDAITDMAKDVARFEIFPGEPISQQKLVKTDEGYLSAVLATGMRGVSVSVGPEAASGGFIVPNDRVDVVLTRATPTGSQESSTVLQNVRVLAIGNRLGETGTTGAPDDPNNPRTAVFATPVIATLEADSSGAEAIINAAMVGKLSLVLRSMTDFSAGTKTDAATDQSIRMTSPFWTK